MNHAKQMNPLFEQKLNKEAEDFKPLVSIIVLTKNQLAYSKQCIDSIFLHTHVPFELIFVDNASTDGTRAFIHQIAQKHNNIKVILNEENKGYGGGNNQGMACSSGDYIVLLNNDVIVTKDWIKGLLEGMSTHSKVGIVGPVSNYVAPPQLIKEPAYRLEYLDSYVADHQQKYKGQYKEVDRVIGFCMVIKRDVVDTIGGFDLRFQKGTFEDDDFCLRALLAGYKCLVAKEVFIHHYGSITFKSSNELDYEQIYTQNLQKFINKWNIKLKRERFTGWTREDIKEKTFHTRHYHPLVAD